MNVSKTVIPMGVIVLLCLIVNCNSAPAPKISDDFDSTELFDQNSVEVPSQRQRVGRFFREILQDTPQFNNYQPNPYLRSG